MDRWSPRISTWRVPAGGSKLPPYVERNFRLKTFGLLGMQFLVVFCMMGAADALLPWGTWNHANLQLKLAFYASGVVSLFMMAALYCSRDRYPTNYVLLVLVTLSVGVFWSLASTVVTAQLHLQLVGILFVTTVVAMLASTLLSLWKADAWTVVISSLLMGWLVGCFIDVVVAPMYGINLTWILLACGVAFFLLALVVLDVGKLLVHCNPDDFMRVIVAMDSALLVVVCIPIFVISMCVLHTDDQRGEEAPAPPV